ncbi:hypothetical protein BDDG_00035 [Blastomyces dermatitidis ATCC 18188]|uniref:Uncharacterized protein n=1 Tax=Ajellomyces dermatitidis (strain ATCC 18188 / CBS 674.68) TaxID=653446 RepID=F2T2I8_AJEDA|nr:hypothetical protein BDDG_00035 [Blastomyces dermatitidis ATCC 18188]
MELKLQRLQSEEFEPDSTSISATDNFFQLWGDTLSAMRLVAAVLFQHLTLSDMARTATDARNLQPGRQHVQLSSIHLIWYITTGILPDGVGPNTYIQASADLLPYALDISIRDIYRGAYICVMINIIVWIFNLASALRSLRVNWMNLTSTFAQLLPPRDDPDIATISYNRGMQNVPQARYVGLPFMDIVDEGNHDKLSPIGVTGELDSSNDTATEAKNTPPFPPSSSDARYGDAFIQDAMCPQAGTIEQLNRQCPTSLPNFKPYTLKEHDVWAPPAQGRPWAKLIVIKGSKGSQQTRITLRISHAQYDLALSILWVSFTDKPMNDQKTLTRPLAYVPSWLNNDEHRPEIGYCGKPPSFGRNVVLINPPDSNTQQYNSTAVVLGFCRYGFILPTYSQ